MSAVLQFCQSPNLRGFSPMVRYSGSVHLEINKTTLKNPAIKIFQCVQFLQFGQSTNLRGFSPMVQYSGPIHLKNKQIINNDNPALKIFQCLLFLQFCQSTILRGFSHKAQYSGSVHLEINKSTAKKIQF